jgi:hypothetical protein
MNTEQQNSHDPKPGHSRSESSRLSPEELLQRVNLLAAHYDYGRVKVLPDISKEAKAVLSHVRVAVVDDLEGILAAVGIDLLVATEDNVALVHHTNQSPSELIRAVVAENPAIILMDGALNNDVLGASLIPRLKQELPHSCIIAHSGSEELNENMVRAGAFDRIHKCSGGGNIDLIASIYSRFISQRTPTPGGALIAANDLDGARVTGPLEGPDLEALAAFSILIQGYLLAVSTPEERAAMGVPDGLLDDDVLTEQRGNLEKSEWWLSPFSGLELEKYMPVALGRCPLLRALIAKLQSAPEVSLTRQEVQSIHDEILAVLEV